MGRQHPQNAGAATSFLGTAASNPSGRPSLPFSSHEELEPVSDASSFSPLGQPASDKGAVRLFPETAAHPGPAELEGFMLGKISRPQMRRVVAHLLRGCRACSQAIEPLASLIFSQKALVLTYRRSQRARQRENRVRRSKGGARRYPMR
jgi:hypothetical protein